jgi:hypothetical protein
MMDAVHRYEGFVAQSLGDGIFALFGAPIAHEDHPQRALYAALKMQEEFKKYAEKLRLKSGVNLEIRVGVNTGEVVVRSIHKDDLHTDYVPIGVSTSLAARMESLANPGTILVSQPTYKLTEGYFQFKELGAAKVKGISEPIPIYEVLGAGPLRTKLQVAARRGLVRFVGRQAEMEQMKRALELAKKGHGQIVAVMGEPGVGKSRLFHEFKQTCQPGCQILETFSISHGKAYSYLPLIDLLKNYFEIAPEDDEQRRRERMTGKVLALDRLLEEMLPYLFSLLGLLEPTSPLHQMAPQIRRQRTFGAIKRLFLRESINQPLILIMEDLQWLDSETEAFINFLSESVATAPILLMVNYRPEYRHEWGRRRGPGDAYGLAGRRSRPKGPPGGHPGEDRREPLLHGGGNPDIGRREGAGRRERELPIGESPYRIAYSANGAGGAGCSYRPVGARGEESFADLGSDRQGVLFVHTSKGGAAA